MKSHKPDSGKKLPTVTERDGSSPLNLTPEQARREAGKLREFSDDLENRKKVEETTARTSPLGRTE